MKTMTTKRTSLKLALVAPLALTALAAAPHARADQILLAQTTLVTGTESTDNKFTVPSAGAITVNLQALDWPTTLNALSFSTTSASSVLASWNGTGLANDVATFIVPAPGTYYTHIMATANPTGLDMGLYSLLMTFTPTVPLPASGWMLLTGLFALAGLARVARSFELTGTAPA